MSYPEPCVGALIVNTDGKVLLASSPKWHGEWIVPGGHVELGETLEHALKREIMEEVGIEIEVVRLLKVQDFINDPSFHKKKHFVFLDFLCRFVSGEPKVDGIELTEYKWLTPEEALETNIDGYSRKLVEAYLTELPCYDNEPREPK
ncbi:MAG: NUDIX domain-containing protein [Candidatus Diapherotrites archaeon]|nr:NUDIX domain-containing protein [Candidatus Diapherotrites archaeon]